MAQRPAWTFDTAGPAAPQLEDDDERHPIEARRLWEQPAPSTDPLDHERQRLHDQLAELNTARLRLALQLRRVSRLTPRRPVPITAPAVTLPPSAERPAFALAPSAAPSRKGGHPGHKARNDRLLALFERTPEHLPHLQRCRMAARTLASEIAARAGQPLERARIMPATTARDAIAEARRRRAG